MEPNPAIVEKLSAHEFLAGIEEEHVLTLAKFAYEDVLEANEYVFHAGEPADHCYLIREGLVSLEVYDPRRGAVTLEKLGSNRALGWSWLIPPHLWTFDARAINRTTVLALDAARVRKAMDADHELGYHLLKRMVPVFADRLRASRSQMMHVF